VLAEIPYGEEMVAADLDADGRLDIVAGPQWLENRGDGTFTPHQFEQNFKGGRAAVADVNGDGKIDVLLSEEDLTYKTRESFFARVAWFENLGDPNQSGFRMHVIDRIRCPHSLSAADLDGDGVVEVVAGEHDPFKPYRARGRLYVYTRAEPKGRAWVRHVLDDRFDHHDGAKIVELAPKRFGIVSHAWQESKYVHLWAP
jgi:hypothetical protein